MMVTLNSPKVAMNVDSPTNQFSHILTENISRLTSSNKLSRSKGVSLSYECTKEKKLRKILQEDKMHCQHI